MTTRIEILLSDMAGVYDTLRTAAHSISDQRFTEARSLLARASVDLAGVIVELDCRTECPRSSQDRPQSILSG